MTPEQCVNNLRSTKEYFDRSTRTLTEAHSGFAPAEGAFTAAQQVAHVAQTIDWFVEGATRPEGFDMDFAAHITAVSGIKSLAEARAWLDRSFKNAATWAKSKTAQELATPLPQGPIMGGAPRFAIISAIEEHTAHHRGALSVYSRLLGLTPPMPYMETAQVS
ncbi:MAG: DinB family protein [Candidatus Hydrogenedentota bacterium]